MGLAIRSKVVNPSVWLMILVLELNSEKVDDMENVILIMTRTRTMGITGHLMLGRKSKVVALIPLLVGKRFQGQLWAATMNRGMPPINSLPRKPNTLLTRVKASLTATSVFSMIAGTKLLQTTIIMVNAPILSTVTRLTSPSSRR